MIQTDLFAIPLSVPRFLNPGLKPVTSLTLSFVLALRPRFLPPKPNFLSLDFRFAALLCQENVMLLSVCS